MNYLRSWGKFLLSEWVLVLNPLHFIWDKWSPLRRHPNYLKLDAHQIHPELGHYEENYEIYTKITDPIFWRWLAVDQLYHVLSNLLLAYLLGVIS